MKTLYLIRHGKGEARPDHHSDHQRKLCKTGEREVRAMSRNLAQRQIQPDIILCSPMERAFQTAEILTRTLDCAPERIALYDESLIGEPERLLHLIRNQPDTIAVVMMIGHQPALSAVAHTFVPYFDATLRTSSVIGIQFSCDTWAAVSEDAARLMFYDFPARLKTNVSQYVQQLIGEHLKQFVRLFLKYQDDLLPKDLEKTIRRSSRRLAKAIVEELHTSPMHAVQAEEPVSISDASPISSEPDAPVTEPTPTLKRKRARIASNMNVQPDA